MRKGKYQKHGVAVKTLVLILTLVLLVGGTVGGTLAWLTASSGPVVNTFTDSDIEIKLEETKKDFKMIPGWTIDKDPLVTVKAGSEDCYVFLKVKEANNLTAYIAYAIDSANWTKLEGATGLAEGETVYYCKATDIAADRVIKVLAAGSYTDSMGTEATADDVTITWEPNQVGVKPSVTKQMMDAIDEAGEAKPTLTFQAYAVQLWKNNTTEFTADEAWTNAQTLDD